MNMFIIILNIHIKICSSKNLFWIRLKTLPLGRLLPKCISSIPAKTVSKAVSVIQISKDLILKAVTNFMRDGMTYRLSGIGTNP